jgi:predicted transcriptional regulator
MTDETTSLNAVELATELTIAWLGNPNTRASTEEIPAFLNRMHEAVSGLGNGTAETASAEQAPEFTAAVTARKSLASKDHIISMIDGKPYKTLRRHLSTHGLTPADYRQRYNLKADYPMVAPSYSEARRSMAQKIGLGRKSGVRAAAAAPAVVPPAEASVAPAPAKRGRKPKSSAPTPAKKTTRGPKPKVAAAPAA